MAKTVNVPEQFAPLFDKAEEVVSKYFSNIELNPEEGRIVIGGDRYILMRGEALFSTLRRSMNEQFGEVITSIFLYELAKTIGNGDAQRFAEKMNLESPVEKLSAGPVHFSHSGWAFVDILPESAPSPDENYVLVYNHPNTFESEHYTSAGKKSDKPVCVFSAGYSAGWCSYSFGLDLDAREISCIARGDSHCRFVMAPPSRIDDRIDDYLKGKLKHG